MQQTGYRGPAALLAEFSPAEPCAGSSPAACSERICVVAARELQYLELAAAFADIGAASHVLIVATALTELRLKVRCSFRSFCLEVHARIRLARSFSGRISSIRHITWRMQD